MPTIIDQQAVLRELVRELFEESHLAAIRGRTINVTAEAIPRPVDKIVPLTETYAELGRSEGLYHAAARLRDELKRLF